MKNNVKDKELIKRTLSYVKKIWWLYIPALVLFSAQDVFATLSAASLQKAAIDFFGAGAYDEKTAGIVRLLLIYLLALLVMIFFAGVMDYVNLYLTNKIKKDLFRAYLVFRPGSGAEEKAGDRSARLINDCSVIASFLTYALGMLLMPVLQATGCMAALCCYHPMLGAGALVCAALSLLYNRLIQPKVRKVSKEQQENNGDFMDRLGDSLSMAETIRTYRQEEAEQEKTGGVIMLGRKIRRRFMLYTAGRVSVSNICNFLYTGAAVGLGVFLFLKGELPLSVLTIIPSLAGGVLAGIVDFCGMTLDLQPILSSMERVFSVIDSSAATDDTKEIRAEADPAAAAVEIAGVGFAYENGSGISDVSLEAGANTYLAIKGEVGCGKSTLMKVLLGLQKKNAGTIRVFGQSQDDMPAESWFENFTYVEQNQKLFLGTIEENILLGEEPDRERLACVLELTGLGEMVKRFPEGIHTMAESGGGNFSGGERQLICFARALYSHAPIMLLDEFSSAFDTGADSRAVRALKAVTGDGKSAIRKTALVISHKEDFIDAADKVLFFQGKFIANHL
ncbi:MAG: ABC transporter ATP-binding protein/permease [Butyrivibrio sp.]|nr:ABC transporter ATP-binding protein/permease [Acetatifactor muris]MCM1558344.1 ABC transporter ATP-binding protein/permease [Butyrivibrio sp.]